jgi:TPR repeat protein
LAGWYLSGCSDPEEDFILNISEIHAYQYVERSAILGLPKAMFALGYFLEHGVGADANLKLAAEWFKRAAASGDSKAMDWCKQRNINIGAWSGKRTGKQSDKNCTIM